MPGRFNKIRNFIAALNEASSNILPASVVSRFTYPIRKKISRDSNCIKYTRDELLDMLVNKLQSNKELKNVPYIIIQVITGKHQAYMKEYYLTGGLVRLYPHPMGAAFHVLF